MVCYAETTNTVANTSVSKETVSVDSGDYDKYVEGLEANDTDKEISVSLKDFTSKNANISYKKGEINWTDGKGNVSFKVSAPTDALYSIKIVWKPLGSGIDPNFALKIDGKIPFSNAQNISLKREWKNVSETPRTDTNGNEYAQEQVETGDYITSVLQDFTGVVTEPYVFEFTKGEHTITLVNPEQPLLIKEISLIIPERVADYSAISKDYNLKDVDAEIITIQGENAVVKNSKSLIPKSNNSDAGMTPNNPNTSKIN
jgi:hypothetical protein